jgi:hypothetical protein
MPKRVLVPSLKVKEGLLDFLTVPQQDDHGNEDRDLGYSSSRQALANMAEELGREEAPPALTWRQQQPTSPVWAHWPQLTLVSWRPRRVMVT